MPRSVIIEPTISGTTYEVAVPASLLPNVVTVSIASNQPFTVGLVDEGPTFPVTPPSGEMAYLFDLDLDEDQGVVYIETDAEPTDLSLLFKVRH